jgi:hypothetical protein
VDAEIASLSLQSSEFLRMDNQDSRLLNDTLLLVFEPLLVILAGIAAIRH